MWPHATLPHLALRRIDWIRLAAVAFLAACAIARVAPDGLRIVEPLGLYGYVTDADGIVERPPDAAVRGSKELRAGDRIRIDRIKPFDRKPGIAGAESFSYDNHDRELPIERHGHLTSAHLIARDETATERATTAFTIALFIVVVCLGGWLFAIRPSIATAAIFVYCLSGDFPATYAEVAFDVPWREIPLWFGDCIEAAGMPALVLFAACLAFESKRVEIALAALLGAFGLLLGAARAQADWRLTYGALPAQSIATVYAHCVFALAVVTVGLFVYAFVKARDGDRRRIGFIAASFALAGIAHLASQALFPSRIAPFWNGVLLASTVLPILVVTFAVFRHRAFGVDLVVSRAISYAAVSGVILAAITVAEEIGTYAFYQNTDLAYGFIIIFSLAVGSTTGKIHEFFDHIVDRFIFRDRAARQEALQFIGGYVLDAEHEDDVYRALLEDVVHALKLRFAGILSKTAGGSFVLTHGFEWPSTCEVTFEDGDDFTKALGRARGATTFTGKQSKSIEHLFPNELLTFAAPLFFERSMSAIVVYGSNVSGLGLDSDERELLVRAVANASVALAAIEIERYRSASLANVRA